MTSPRFRILAVDDSEDILALLEVTLGKEYEVKSAADARSALQVAFERPRPDLILLDVEMPGTNGYDLCRALKASPALADIPVIFLTQRDDARDVVQGFQLGAIDYFAKPINPPVLAARIRAHVELISRRGLQDELIRVRTTQLEQTRLQLIRRLGRAMEYHETSAVGNRVVRLGHYARALAEASGAKPDLCDLIMKAAPLHDIGKLGVPAQILRKAEKLTAPERAQMQRHPEIGAEIIGEHDDPLLKLARTLALTHHECWDGKGYPAGLGGDTIPWPGRVMALVDAFEGMTATQFHREPMSLELAADEISRGAGKQFDPRMVEAFRKCLPDFRKVKETYADSLGDMLDLDFSAAPPQPPAPAAAAAHREAAETTAAQRMRDTDEARAGVLAGEQARLRVERDLLSAAAKDVSTQQAARKRAEAAAAREAEAMVLARRRIAEDAAAVQAAQERAKAEADAAALAQQAEREKAQALAAAEARLAAERGLATAAGERTKAEAALAATAASLAAKDTEALETAGRRLEGEREATRAAIARAKAEADAAAIAQKAAQANAELLADAQMRAEAEHLLAEAAQEKRKAEEAAAQAAVVLAAAEKQKAAAAARRAADEAAAKAAMEKRVAAETETAQASQEAAASTISALADADAIAGLQARIGADREGSAAAARKASEERSAAVSARERAAREAEALEAARQRIADDEAATRAATERVQAEREAAQLAREAAQAAAQLVASAEARAKAEQALAEAVDKRRTTADTQTLAHSLTARPAPAGQHSQRKAFLYATGFVALAAAAVLYENEPQPPAVPPVSAPTLTPGLSEGPALSLRLESDVGRIVPRERAK
jgi:putative two-component system response regulator